MKNLHLMIVAILSFNFFVIDGYYVTLHKDVDRMNRWERPRMNTEGLSVQDTLSVMLLFQQLNFINMDFAEDCGVLEELKNKAGTFISCSIDLSGTITNGLTGHMLLRTRDINDVHRLQEILDNVVDRFEKEHNVHNVSYQIDVISK